jgi:2-succinyl-5-enolpyruvyl-6-hydroxy-3-cyclohexene-1-carboxylate synthase
MNSSSARLNTHLAHILFSTLKQLGIDSVFMAPGSRSSPLALAAFHYAINFYTHFDERALGFMALGYTKSQLKPAVIITTSGSAVGNLLPAIMEAYMKKLPLIVITADRPHELHHRGANQTLKQNGLFDDYTIFSTSFETPQHNFNEKAFSSLISYSAFIVKKGPVHLNIPLSEPLFDPIVDFPHDVEFRKDLTFLPQFDFKNKKGILILGEEAALSLEEATYFNDLSEVLDFPIMADISSGYRSHGLPYLYYSPFILDTISKEIEVIWHFGTKIISKSLENLLKKFSGTYIHFDETQNLYDPLNRIDYTVRLNEDLKKELLNLPPQKTFFKENIYSFNAPLKDKLEQLITEYPSYEEAMYCHLLSKLDLVNTQIFCGNSLPIRHMDTFFCPDKPTATIFTQRGVSGIDGLIATACGLSTNEVLTYALLGDLSSLYDINALALIVANKLKVIPIVFNNHGGGIFSYLPIASQTPHFNRLMSTNHVLNFKDLAHGFDLDYIQISSLEEFESFLKNPTLYTLIEIVSSQEGNPKFLDKVKESVCSFIKELSNNQTLLSSCTDSWDLATMPKDY